MSTVATGAPQLRRAESTDLSGVHALRAIGDAEARGAKALYLLTTTAESYFPSFGFRPTPRGYPSATSRIIITMKPPMNPSVAMSVLSACCVSGITSSTTT